MPLGFSSGSKAQPVFARVESGSLGIPTHALAVCITGLSGFKEGPPLTRGGDNGSSIGCSRCQRQGAAIEKPPDWSYIRGQTKAMSKEVIQIRFLRPGRIVAPKPSNFDTLSPQEKLAWANQVLAETSDANLVQAMSDFAPNEDFFDETPEAVALHNREGETLASSSVWEAYTQQPVQPL